MCIPWKHIPQDIRDRYKLEDKVHQGFVYVKINRGMYGLKEAASLAYQQVTDHLRTFGYTPIPGSPSIFKHTTQKTKFCLCVDDFGIKYYLEEDEQHLKDALFSKYKGTVDMSGNHFCGFKLD